MYEIVTKILVPIFVGIVLKLVTIGWKNRTRNKQVASNRCCLNSKKRHPTTIGCLFSASMHDFVTSYFKFIIGPIFCQGIFLSFLFNLLNKNILIFIIKLFQ